MIIHPPSIPIPRDSVLWRSGANEAIQAQQRGIRQDDMRYILFFLVELGKVCLIDIEVVECVKRGRAGRHELWQGSIELGCVWRGRHIRKGVMTEYVLVHTGLVLAGTRRIPTLFRDLVRRDVGD
jgi:hypothetical protein